MKKALKIFISILLAIPFFYFCFLNVTIYYSPEFTNRKGQEINQDLLNQLRFLKQEIHGEAGDKMQEIYPEGFFFMHMLYGLTWCELAKSLKPGTLWYREANLETAWAFSQVNSQKGRSIFDPSLDLPYGAFYLGWSTYQFGKMIEFHPAGKRSEEDLRVFEFFCDRIAEHVLKSENPYPESYSGQAWPSDITVGMAALALHDSFLEKKYGDAIASWISKVKTHLDSSGMIPHRVDPVSGETLEEARGSSQSLILNFLFEIDPVFARQQFSLYKKHFLDTRFGLPGIREYRHGSTGFGDVDSGPVILGIGGSASVVGLRTMALFGEYEIAEGLRNSIEAFGMGYSRGHKKKYLFGAIPVADAFIAWANSTEIDEKHVIKTNGNWQYKFHLWSILFIAPVVLLFLRTWRLKPWKKKNISGTFNPSAPGNTP